MADQAEEVTPVIDWNDYYTDRTEDRDKYIVHDVPGCGERETYLWSLQEAIDWALEHNKVCAEVG